MTHPVRSFLLPLLIAGLGLLPWDRAAAQTYKNLHSFTGGSGGGFPRAGLISSGNALYGTTIQGGTAGKGTLFKITTNGTGFAILHHFTANPAPSFANGDGANPVAGLVLSDNILYGTAFSGGDSGNGSVFSVNISGSGFKNLHSFTANSGAPDYTNGDGAWPQAGLVVADHTLYGTANGGGTSDKGALFTLNTDGTGFETLHQFSGGSDGVSPQAGLVLSDNVLYGTATRGGLSGGGTVFKVNADGSGFAILHDFTGNGDGVTPSAGLILAGNTLYGTALGGGDPGKGTVFSVQVDGTDFRTLHAFVGGDGAGPRAGLVLSGSTLYGTASEGGGSGHGSVFAVNTHGGAFAILHSFTAASGSFPATNGDGYGPQAGLVLVGNILYGTAGNGGSSGYGTLFSVALPPPPALSINRSGAEVIVSWPGNSAGFFLQSTTDMVPPGVWTTVSPDPIVVNGKNTVVHPISGAQDLYRLTR